MSRTERVTILVSVDELEAIEAVAERFEMTAAEYVRECVLDDSDVQGALR